MGTSVYKQIYDAIENESLPDGFELALSNDYLELYIGEKYDVAVFDNDNNLSFIIEYDGEQHEYGCRFSPIKEENDMTV